MKEKFKTLFVVKSSLTSLYLALTIPIPFIAIEKLKILSIISFVFGLFLIINITNDYVNTCDKKISYNISFLSKILGRKSWEICWKDIKLINPISTSQGSKVHYFITNKEERFLVPQRIENLEKFVLIISKKTKLKTSQLNYLSPLWTYELLTCLSVFMIIGEIIAFIS